MAEYRTALITGASSGIGAAFAERLAAKGCALILVARSEATLQAQALALQHRYGVRVEVAAIDLSAPEPGATLRRIVEKCGLEVDLLINNAGFGTFGTFARLDAAREQQEIRLNCGAVVDLCHAFVPTMQQRGHGAIVNIASTAAFQPLPYLSTYAASKAFVRAFSDALWVECKAHNVHVLCVCPGPVETAFFAASGNPSLRTQFPQWTLMRADAVVVAVLRGLYARRRLVVPGWTNRLIAALSQLTPRNWLLAALGRVIKPADHDRSAA